MTKDEIGRLVAEIRLYERRRARLVGLVTGFILFVAGFAGGLWGAILAAEPQRTCTRLRTQLQQPARANSVALKWVPTASPIHDCNTPEQPS